jgi:hypothetical protein
MLSSFRQERVYAGEVLSCSMRGVDRTPSFHSLINLTLKILPGGPGSHRTGKLIKSRTLAKVEKGIELDVKGGL